MLEKPSAIQLKKLSKKLAEEYIKKFDGELDETDLNKTIKFLNISRLEFLILSKNTEMKIFGQSGNKFELKM